MRRRILACSLLLIAALSAGCLGGDAPRGPTGHLAVAVAPLSLPGITDAEYVLTVHNGPDGTGDVVWTRTLRSSSYGDGAGSLSYVGTCDAATGVNTITLELLSLEDASGVLPAGSYMNPTPVSKPATCVADADVAVTFDIALARRAEQGFFDVAVQFEDVFCSAKLDCQADDGSDLDLLHAPGGGRDMTVVMGLACTGSLTGETYLYIDDPVVSCTGLAQEIRVDPTGMGNVDLTAAPSANADGYLFAASVYRGVEGLANKAYWNVSLGLDATTFAAAGDCTLTGRATASATPFPQQPAGFPLPEGSVYPVIDWQVVLSGAAGRVCTRHQVDVVDSGVATHYLGYLPPLNGFTWSPDPITLRHRYEPGTGVVLSAGSPICNPSCAHGACVATDTCDCTGTGYEGALCDVPACASPCENGGSCVAPDTCACLDGFWGAACENACTPVAHCAVPPTCTDATDSSCGACDTGYLPDGAGGCVECLGVDDCSDDANPCTVKACVANACVQEPGNAGVECRAAADVCDVAEQCDGVAVDCPTDLFTGAGTECRAAAGACDVAEQCTGSGPSCPADARVASGTECRAVVGDCDVAEQCDGVAADCPVDAFVASGTECRAAAGACDVAEQCTGSGASCPADARVASGTECRAAAGLCDVPEACDGVAAVCPADVLVPDKTTCRAAAGDCDVEEQCDGVAPTCPTDARVPSGTQCRAVAGLCDVAEQCDGTSVDCPTDAVLPDKTVCRSVAGDCDVEEQCDGVAATCPADALVASGVECRAAVGDCDVAEQCTGGAAACPADAKVTAGTACGDASDTVCDNPDTCDGAGTCLANHEPSSTVCRADAGACDVAETCDGAGSCPADGFEPDGTACSNGVFCDGAETCASGSCVDNADPCPAGSSECDEANDVCVVVWESCYDAWLAGERTSGPYRVDPDLGGTSSPTLTVYCDMTSDGGGWTFVRRCRPNGSGWENPNDNLAGTAASGTYQADPTAAATFSMKFSDMSFTQMMFRTGDGVKWIIVPTSSVYSGWDGAQPASTTITKSHWSATAYTALWYKRTVQPEDPWISAYDHSYGGASSTADSDTHSMLYGENSYPEWDYWLDARNGANVWVR